MANSMQALCIRGYHIYQTIWQAALGETFDCIRETHNSKDRYAVMFVVRVLFIRVTKKIVVLFFVVLLITHEN